MTKNLKRYIIRKVRRVRIIKDENMKNVQENRFIVSVKVGAKGQITIPVEARNMFDIKEGDTLMVMGDINRGLALVKSDEFYNLMGDIFNVSNKD